MRFLPTDVPDHLRVHGPKRRLLGTAAAVAGLLVLAGCQMPGGSSAATGPTVSATLTVSAPAGVADAPLYIGIRDHLFKDAGLTIKLQSYSVKSAIGHLRNGGQPRKGSVDIAFGDYADAFYANEQAKSPNLAIVADGYDCGPNVVEVMTLPGSTITSPQELAGKRIGTALPENIPASNAHPYSEETTATWAVLNNDNVQPAAIHWDPMPADSLASALHNNQVDAILATEPTITHEESSEGLVPVLDSCSGPTANLPLDGYFATHAFAAKNQAVLAAFRSALAKAQADAAISTPVQAALENYANMDKQTASLVTIGTYPTVLAPLNIQRVATLMFFFNTPLANPVDVQKLVTMGR